MHLFLPLARMLYGRAPQPVHLLCKHSVHSCLICYWLVPSLISFLSEVSLHICHLHCCVPVLHMIRSNHTISRIQAAQLVCHTVRHTYSDFAYHMVQCTHRVFAHHTVRRTHSDFAHHTVRLTHSDFAHHMVQPSHSYIAHHTV